MVNALSGNWKPAYDFLLVINSNVGPISHCFWDTYSDLLAQNGKFSLPLSHLAPLLGVTPFQLMKKLYWSWN